MNAIFHTMVTLETFNYMDRSLLEKYVPDKPIEKYVPDKSIRTLISILENNSNIGFRNRAATQLGSFHDPSVVDALIKCVKNDPKVRYSALVSLRKIGDRLAIPVFIERSKKDRSARICLVSVIALGEIGDKSVIEHLESLIKSKDYQKTIKNGGNPEIIQAAKDALQKIRSREPQPPPDKQERQDRKILIQRIKETESFGVLPSPIKDSVQQPDALRYPDEVIALLSQLDEFLKTAHPQINLHLLCKQIALDTWEKENISITNEGSAHAKNITIEFPDDVDVRRIKTLDILAGETKRFEIRIRAKVKGTIPLDITVTYCDALDKSYTDTFDFDIEVIEKESITPPPPSPSILPPELAADYPVSSYLGEGGFARVYRAKKQDGTEVALKIPNSLNRIKGKALYNEMQIWTKLDHRNIVRVLDFSITPMPYLELELCDQSLDKLPKPMPPDEAARIIFDIAEGLKFAHDRKIIHRDLKPQNILLKNGIPKISDWGLSRVMTESKSTTATSFTLYYAAPEQISGEHKDERTDIWQLGVILYELVTGQLPFTGDSPGAVMTAITTRNPQSPTVINPSLHDVEAMIIKCLEKDPDKRYQSVLELQKALEILLQKNYAKQLKMSAITHDFRKSAIYCGDLVMFNLMTGDIVKADLYLSDLVNYSKGDVKVEAQKLAEHLKYLIDHGSDEVEDKFIQKVEIIVHKVRLGSGTM